MPSNSSVGVGRSLTAGKSLSRSPIGTRASEAAVLSASKAAPTQVSSLGPAVRPRERATVRWLRDPAQGCGCEFDLCCRARLCAPQGSSRHCLI